MHCLKTRPHGEGEEPETEYISDPDLLYRAWSARYHGLALTFAEIIGSHATKIVELGCGRGQLTVPLARLVPSSTIVAVDEFQGPYRAWNKRLKAALRGARLEDRVKVVVSDCSRWLRKQPPSAYDAVLSSELFPEFDSDELKRFISEAHRVLQPRGLTVNSFLSPHGSNPRQRLFIEADSEPKWTKRPPKEWFSPPPVLVRRELRRAGVAKIRTRTVQTRIRFTGRAVSTSLQSWGVRRAFLKLHQKRLSEDGLESPDWIVIEATKSASF